MMSALGGITMATGLLYLGSNDAVYDDPSAFSGLMKAGFVPVKPRFPGGAKELGLASPFPETSLSDLLSSANGTAVRSAAGVPCGGSSADHMECFMILTPGQQLTIAVLALTLGSFTVLENVAVLGVILLTQTLRRRPSYLFIGSLAAADLLGSVIFVYSFLDFHVLHRKDTPPVFLFKLAGVITSFSASVGSLFLTAIDRYVSVQRPVAYKRIVTRARAVAAFTAMWAGAATFSLLPLLGWNCRSLASACSELFPLMDRRYLMLWIGVTGALVLFIVYAYVFILWKAHRHALRMMSRGAQRSVVLYAADGNRVQTGRPEQARVDLRLAKTLALILVVLLLCWGPVLAIMIYELFWKVSDALKAAFAFCCILCLLNSTVNPVIYALRSKDLRRAFLHLLRPRPSSDGGGCCGQRAPVGGPPEGNQERRSRGARVTLSGGTETSGAELV
ncbi:cannabinoid receptor type 1B [Gadus morhua]|uniref:Cannabinoid receptor 1 n=1 Tax=Gadus morhua TaxID=8049 RepID=A0A8C5FXB6_GADMO|nr:cannabinoid receptor type 1B-like [Gadus morhua]